MSAADRPRIYDAKELALWQACPRRHYFERVAGVPAHPVLTSFAAPLGAAGEAGVKLVLLDPQAGRALVKRQMLAAFEDVLQRGLEGGRVFDPDRVEAALAKLEDDYLELVVLLGQDERVHRIEWTAAETRYAWDDGRGRRFAGQVAAVGVARERVAGFGERQGEPADLDPGTHVLVDWRFGSDLDLSPVGLALHLPLGFDLSGFGLAHPDRRYRGFVAALRDLRPRKVVKDERGQAIPRFVEDLNPDYLLAFACGQPITPLVVKEAEASRRRFVVEGEAIPKRVRRPNPAWIAATSEPRGPLFHEAVIAWDVLGPTLLNTVLEIDAAEAVGSEDAFPARGPATRACFTCPFRQRCVRGA